MNILISVKIFIKLVFRNTLMHVKFNNYITYNLFRDF